MTYPQNTVNSVTYPRAVCGAFHVQFVALDPEKPRAVCGASLYLESTYTLTGSRGCGAVENSRFPQHTNPQNNSQEKTLL